MKINKEGYKIIGITGLICLLLGTGIYRLLSSHDNGTLVWVLVVLMLLFLVFHRGVLPRAAPRENT